MTDKMINIQISDEMINKEVVINGKIYKPLTHVGYITKKKINDKTMDDVTRSLFTYDILNIINEFVIDFNTIFSLHKTCKHFYHHKFNIECKNDQIHVGKLFANIIVCKITSNQFHVSRCLFTHYLRFHLLEFNYKGVHQSYVKFINESLCLLPKLTSLSCASSCRTFSYAHLMKNTMLQTLDLSECKGYFASDDIGVVFKSLQKLILYDSSIMFTDYNCNPIKFCKDLTYLNCARIKGFPSECFDDLTKLTTLIMYKSVLDPTHIMSLQSLTYLNCSHCNYIDDNIINKLLQLKKLICNNCKTITENAVFPLIHLETFVCFGTKVNYIMLIKCASIKYLGIVVKNTYLLNRKVILLDKHTYL